MTHAERRYVYLFVTEGDTDMDALRVVLTCYLRHFKKIDEDDINSPIPPNTFIRYLSDLSKVTPGTLYSGKLNKYSIRASKDDVEVIIFSASAPYTLYSAGYEGVIGTILRYLNTKILEKKKIHDPIVTTEFRIVGLMDIDVFLEKEWKPEHNKHVHNTLYHLLDAAPEPSSEGILGKLRKDYEIALDNVKVSELVETDIRHNTIMINRIPRLAKVCYEGSFAYLLFWGHCEDRYFYEAVEDVEATIIDEIGRSSKAKRDLKEAAKELAKILPKSNSCEDKVARYYSCLMNDEGTARIRLERPLDLLAFAVGEKHPVSFWRKRRRPILEKVVNKDKNFCSNILEKCELKEALDMIFSDIP